MMIMKKKEKKDKDKIISNKFNGRNFEEIFMEIISMEKI